MTLDTTVNWFQLRRAPAELYTEWQSALVSIYQSPSAWQLYPKVALSLPISRFFRIEFNTLQLASIPECSFDPVLEGEWYRYGLDVRMPTLGRNTTCFEENGCRVVFGIQCAQRCLISIAPGISPVSP